MNIVVRFLFGPFLVMIPMYASALPSSPYSRITLKHHVKQAQGKRVFHKTGINWVPRSFGRQTPVT